VCALAHANADDADVTLPPAIPMSLTPEQLQQLGEAQIRWKKIRRAIAVARFDAWGVGIFACLTLLSVVFSWIALPLGLGMAAVALIEFRSANRLRRLDPTAPRVLAFNQIFFGCLLLAYAIYMLYRTHHDPGEYSQMIGNYPELNGTLGSIDSLAKMIGTLLYGGLAVIAITVQGGSAIFYFRREKLVREYIAETPPWIMQMQQAGAGL
jgi:hypothetical protein